MKRTIIAAATAGLLGLGLMFPAVAMPVSPLAPTTTSASDIIQVRGGHGHGGGHAMRRGGRGHHHGWQRGRGHHYGWSRGHHRGWR
ncbi:hypothetical protein [Rhodopseudomonas sp. RCAM05734]|uniref:hypothetical protein n=1 Tax=Rhodopseudomonas sp. RCAM05734 TaxID=3457549 RepID=UPI0040441BB8